MHLRLTGCYYTRTNHTVFVRKVQDTCRDVHFRIDRPRVEKVTEMRHEWMRRLHHDGRCLFPLSIHYEGQGFTAGSKCSEPCAFPIANQMAVNGNGVSVVGNRSSSGHVEARDQLSSLRDWRAFLIDGRTNETELFQSSSQSNKSDCAPNGRRNKAGLVERSWAGAETRGPASFLRMYLFLVFLSFSPPLPPFPYLSSSELRFRLCSAQEYYSQLTHSVLLYTSKYMDICIFLLRDCVVCALCTPASPLSLAAVSSAEGGYWIGRLYKQCLGRHHSDAI